MLSQYDKRRQMGPTSASPSLLSSLLQQKPSNASGVNLQHTLSPAQTTSVTDVSGCVSLAHILTTAISDVTAESSEGSLSGFHSHWHASTSTEDSVHLLEGGLAYRFLTSPSGSTFSLFSNRSDPDSQSQSVAVRLSVISLNITPDN